MYSRILFSTLGVLLMWIGVNTAWATDCLAPDPALMQGSPPPADKRVGAGTMMAHPANRWAFQHIRELQATREVSRGVGPASAIVEVPVDLDAVTYTLHDGRRISLETWMRESCTDSFLVMHRGKLAYERYFNGMGQRTQHQMFSATKSLIATITLLLIDAGKIDAAQTIGHYIPELKNSAFGNATVQQMLDMTNSISFAEVYTDPNADIWKYGYIFGIGGAVPANYKGPRTIYDYLPTLKKGSTDHGEGFHYVTPNTDVLGWLNSRITGKNASQLVSEYFWQPIGAERDGYFWLGSGTEMAGGGLNIAARDAARFGQMILQEGRYNGRQVLSPAIAKRILWAGNPDTFTAFYDDPWYLNVGYAYHDMWWTFNNPHKAVSAIGVHGQFIYLDPVADMVIVKQSSHPDAEGDSNEVDGPQIWHQIATRLMRP